MSGTTDLKTLVAQMERRRKDRERRHMVLAVFGAIVVLGGASVLASGMISKEAPVAEVTPPSTAYDTVTLSAEAAIVYDLTTGDILYEKNSESQLPLASLTKLLTLYAAADALPPRAPITFSSRALSSEGDNGFTEGETFAFEDIAKAALVGSSNDAAAAIAEAATDARHVANSSALLAAAVTSLGLSQTYALNGTGLDENGTISGAYGSVRDIAVLAGEFLKRAPNIARASIDPSVTVTSLNGFSYTLKNTNPGVGHIPGLRLSKTGYTDLAGGNLAIVYDAGINHPVAVVVMGSTRDDRFLDVDRLVKATADHFSSLTLP